MGLLEPDATTVGRRRDPPWTGRQFFTGLGLHNHTLTFTPRENLEFRAEVLITSKDARVNHWALRINKQIFKYQSVNHHPQHVIRHFIDMQISQSNIL